MIPVRMSEVLRYLGYRTKMDGTDISVAQSMIDACIEDMNQVAEPRTTWRRFPLTFADQETMVIADMTVHSHDLTKNLAGCREVFLIAGTLGPGVDRLIRRNEIGRMSRAMACQAIGAEMIEQVMDKLNASLDEAVQDEGLWTKPRYSPGYGDVTLAHQRDFERLLTMSRQCGITLTDTLLMVPSKSVTAFIGITDQPQPDHHYGCNCDYCEAVNCSIRRESSE
jgi:hypothetical protein